MVREHSLNVVTSYNTWNASLKQHIIYTIKQQPKKKYNMLIYSVTLADLHPATDRHTINGRKGKVRHAKRTCCSKDSLP